MLEFPVNLCFYLAGGGLALLLVAVALRKVAPFKARVPGWLGGGLLGAAAGAGLALGCVGALGYAKPNPTQSQSDAAPTPPVMMGGGMGMMGGGQGGMMMGGAGGGSRRLTSLVGKLDLLSLGVRIDLTAEQQQALAEQLADLDEAAELSADDADARVEALEALLTSEQRQVLDTIALPRARPAGGGGPGGMMGMMGGGMMGGAAGPAKNPFKEAPHAGRLNSLRGRLGAVSTGTDAAITEAGEASGTAVENESAPTPEEKVEDDLPAGEP